MQPADIVRFIEGARWPLSNEKLLQSEIETQLQERGVEFEREVRLFDGDIIDFVLDGSIGVEVKIKGSKLAIYRQVERYCLHDRVQSLVLVTNVATGLPQFINGKPTFIASLGKGWL